MIRKLLATTAIATLMATGAAMAQTTTPAPTTTAPTEAAPQVKKAEGHLASNLIGETVYNGTSDDAENIGEVNDLVMSEDGQVEAIVVGVGGFLGIGEKNVALEFDLIEWAEMDGDEYIVVETTKEALEAQPDFDINAFEFQSADAEVGNTEPATAEDLAAAPATDEEGEASDDMAAAPADDAAEDTAAAPAEDDAAATDDTAAAPAAGDTATEEDTAAAPADDAAEDTAAAPAEDDAAATGDTAAAPADDATQDTAAAPAEDDAAATGDTAAAPADDATEDTAAAPAEDDAATTGGAATGGMAAAPADDSAAGTDDTQTAAIDRESLTEVNIDEVSTEEFVGTAVYGANDEHIGEISDVILSQDKVDAVIVDVGGFLGIGEKQVAVSMENLAFMSDEDGNMYLYTGFTQEQLEAQPEYDEKSFAEARDEQLLVNPVQ